MKQKINGITVEILVPEYDTQETIDKLEVLLENHSYNLSVDWNKYRTVNGKHWAPRKSRSPKENL